MLKNKYLRLSLAVVVILLAAGALIPIGTYTAHDAGFDVCPASKTPQSVAVRLDLIKGQTLSQVKKVDSAHRFYAGCSPATQYKLYLL